MYNEEKGAVKCIDKVIKVISGQSIKTSLLVINDGSVDTTEEILRKKQKQYHKQLFIITNRKNLGYGGALQEGIKKASQEGFEYCLFMDSDLTNNPNDILKFINEIPGDFDCVKASRYIKGGGMENVPLHRQVISFIGNALASFLFGMGIKDCTNGFRMVKVKLEREISFKEKGFAIILEELYHLKKQHVRCKEIPSVLTARKETVSHFMYNIHTFYSYGKYGLKAFFVLQP